MICVIIVYNSWINYTINHSWGCSVEESKGAFLEEVWEGWNWDKLARPLDRLEPLTEEPVEESRTAWWAGLQAAKADPGRALVDWDPHLIGSTRFGTTTRMTWVFLARAMLLRWAEWRGSCTKILYMRPSWDIGLWKVNEDWQQKLSLWNFLTSPWWSS